MEINVYLQENLKKEFKKYIEENGIKQNYIAKQLNIPTSSISRWKNNKNNLSFKNLVKINNYLNKKNKRVL